MADALYLLVIPDPDAIPDRLDLCGDGRAFAPGVYCIASELSRSKLYHRIKWQLPDGTGLLVAPLADAPKFKGMDEGALAWLRSLDLS
ncbi:MAG: hypothetical protein CL808_02450 [Citromicrobium sp.]|nr:hypothetical protein [Citromicrobium sp.]